MSDTSPSTLPSWVMIDPALRLPAHSPALMRWHMVHQHLAPLAALLNVEIVLIDDAGYCVGGTGPYQSGLGVRVPKDNALAYSLASGQSTMVLNPGQDQVCRECSVRGRCGDMANFTGPIVAGGRVVAVVQIVAFTDHQRAGLLVKAEKAFDLIQALIAFVYTTECAPGEDESVSSSHESLTEILGESPAMQQLKRAILKAASNDATVLVQGESGTGKELVAKAIHALSARRQGPFVAVNCGAFPETLMESELFGYAPGAFSGATRTGSAGLLEQARGGTFFLDEVSEMPPALQVKLLRVLQERTVRRVGGREARSVDVRIIAACNANLRTLMQQGTFREDLFFRLDVIPILVPPLRERLGDIRLLVTHFLDSFSREKGRTFRVATELMHDFENYTWPGNVRELKNFVEYGVNFCDNNVLTLDVMRPRFVAACTLPAPELQSPRTESAETTAHVQLLQLLDTFGHHTEGKRAVAKHLGISLATLYRQLKRTA